MTDELDKDKKSLNAVLDLYSVCDTEELTETREYLKEFKSSDRFPIGENLNRKIDQLIKILNYVLKLRKQSDDNE